MFVQELGAIFFSETPLDPKGRVLLIPLPVLPRFVNFFPSREMPTTWNLVLSGPFRSERDQGHGFFFQLLERSSTSGERVSPIFLESMAAPFPPFLDYSGEVPISLGFVTYESPELAFLCRLKEIMVGKTRAHPSTRSREVLYSP